MSSPQPSQQSIAPVAASQPRPQGGDPSRAPQDIINPTCPECGDALHPMSNFCPRCMVPVFPDPNASESVREIQEPQAVDCFILSNNNQFIPILAAPRLDSRRLVIMTGKDVVLIHEEMDYFYRVLSLGGIEGYILKDKGLRVRVGLAEVKDGQPWGYFRVNEFLIGWKFSTLPYKIQDAPIKTEPNFKSPTLARIKSDIVLPVVGETYGWFEVQLPSFFRGWVPEAYGYRMLRSDSLPEVSKPWTAADILAGVVGIAGVVTLVGVGAAISAIADSK